VSEVYGAFSFEMQNNRTLKGENVESWGGGWRPRSREVGKGRRASCRQYKAIWIPFFF